MNQKDLMATLNRWIESLGNEQKDILTARLEALFSVYPFNEYEYILSFLIDQGIITFEEYEQLRANYVNENRHLNLFELPPRTFGQGWGEKHLMDLDERFRQPAPTLDPNFEGDYDLWIQGVRVEVKTSRATNTKKKGPLVSKALSRGTDEPFWMNFQQLKVSICDVFVFIAVWVDEIEYWVLSADEVKDNDYFSPQHRGGIEYQIGFRNNNIAEFAQYKVKADAVADTVLKKGLAER